MEPVNFKCNICFFGAKSFEVFRNHYVRTHQNDPNFNVACQIESCGYTTKKWNNFKVHVSRRHKIIESATDTITCNDDGNDYLDAHYNESEPFSDISYTNSIFAASLQAKHNIPESAIDSIMTSAAVLVENHVHTVLGRVKRKLMSDGHDPEFLKDLSTDHQLHSFTSAPKRLKRFEHDLGYIKPSEVVLGQFYHTIAGHVTTRSRIGYYIPLKESLHNLLSMPEVWEQVNSSHHTSDRFMRDICDGDYVRFHQLFGRNAQAMQLLLNTDDLEVVNPIGTHIKKHKVTVFYYSLGNIRPEYRSRLSAIQLVAIAKTKDLRATNGENHLLNDFITTANKLSNGGVEFTLHGSIERIEGAVVLMCADTLAAHWIGKFKEGVSFAEKFCRTCELSRNDMAACVFDVPTQHRDIVQHRLRCKDLESLSKGARSYWSKMWGINGSSCLLHLSDFSFTSCLVHDPMHVLLEGVVPHDLRQMLSCLIGKEKLFSLEFVNSAIHGFKYSYLHSVNKPEKIEHNQIFRDGALKQTSAAMLTLLHILPLVVGHRVPRGNRMWLNFMRLFQIVLLCTTPYCSRETASLLRILIALYLQEFKVIHPNASFLPKMHYMVHFPQQMLHLGPLRHHWCMRYEGKNGFFKLKKYKNFKNLPLTMAKHHQLYMCYKQAAPGRGPNLHYLYDGDDVKEGAEVSWAVLYPDLQNELFITDEIDTVYQTSCVCIHGLRYKTGCALVVKYDAADTPSFVIVRDIIVHKQTKYFIIEQAVTEFFDCHILAYVIAASNQLDVLPYYDLVYTWPLSVYNYEDKLIVQNAYSHACEIF